MSSRGFMLLELVITIGIIGFMAAAIAVALTEARQRARVTGVQSYASQVFRAVGAACSGIWEFEEGSGSTAKDSCFFSSNDGRIRGARRVNGVGEGSALSFDGNDYVSLRKSYFGRTIEQLSACAWLQTTEACGSSYCNWSLIDFDNSEFYNLYVHGDGRVGFSTNASNGRNSTYSNVLVNDGEWHYACGVYDGTDKKIYVDGQLDRIRRNPHGGRALGDTVTRYGFIGDGSESNRFDGRRNRRYFVGLIDDVRIYDEAIPSAMIQQHFAEGMARLLAAHEAQ